MAMITIDGVRIAYDDAGDGVPVLLMHGNPDTRQLWNGVRGQLGTGLRVIAPDFPGFGDSDALPADQDLGPAGMAAFWGRFIDALALAEPFIAVVHDFGGPWLLPWIARNPERVRGLVVTNTLFQRDYRWHFWARIWQRPWVGEAAMRLMTRLLFARVLRHGSPQVARKHIDAAYDRVTPRTKDTVLRVYRAYADPAQVFAGWEERLIDALPRIPTRVIWGERDPFIDARFAARYGVAPTRLPDHGHWHPVSKPRPTAHAIMELAGRTPG